MNRKLLFACALGGLVAAAALALLAATANFDRVQGRYPGSLRAEDEDVGFAVQQGLLNRRAVFWTEDDMRAVRSWYAALLYVEAGSDGNGLTAGDCAWLTNAQQTFVVNHTVTVLVCSTSPGTRIVVNESVYLWP